MRAVERLTAPKLQLGKFGFESSTVMSQASTSQLAMAYDEDKMLSNKLAILINDIAIAMGKLSFATYRGKIYKKDASSMFTFSYNCEARAFMSTLATNEQFKSMMLPQMKKIIKLLLDHYCELFRPLTVDNDLIEVNNSACWSLKRKSFMEDASTEHQIGKVIHPEHFTHTSQTKCSTQNSFARFWKTASVQTTYADSVKNMSNFSITTTKSITTRCCVWSQQR